MRAITLLLAAVLVFTCSSGAKSLRHTHAPKPVSARAAVSWSAAEATPLLLLSFSTYCGSLVNASWSCYWCKKLPQTWRFIGTFGAAASPDFGVVGILQDRKIVVAYRGTDNLAGWIEDFTFFQDPLPGTFGPADAEVHRGFLHLVQNSSAQVVGLVNEGVRMCPQCSVTFTGHSLGGALALLGASIIANQNGWQVEMHRHAMCSAWRHCTDHFSFFLPSFAGPRVGNPSYAAWIASSPSITSMFRLTSHHDPVPLLPPASLPLVHYNHPTREVYDPDGNNHYSACSATNGEDPTCIDSTHVWQYNALDHAQYLGFNALDGVPHRCLFTDPSMALKSIAKHLQ